MQTKGKNMEHEAWWEKVADEPLMVWCLRVAGLGVDELATAGLLSWGDFDRAKKIVAQEIYIRMIANDLPPPDRP
jgi:hypothetical protein